MALDVETKAHNDKPFYAVAVRLGVTSAGQNGTAYLKALSAFLSVFQIGGRPFLAVTEKEYGKISQKEITDMFIMGTTYRTGFLANSAELAGFVHVPQAGLLEYRKPPILILETLPVRNKDLCSGTPIGTCEYAGVKSSVCIPPELRSRSTHIIGRPGQAMSHGANDTVQKVALFRSYFSRLTNVYGTYDPGNGRSWQAKEPVTRETILAHLQGKRPYGVYLLVRDRTRVIAADFDDTDAHPPIEFMNKAKHYRLPVYLETSKSKKFHVWIFFQEQGVKASKARLVVKSILDEIG